ncbi:hypothetical protein PQX77_019240 [Marasmius sp. AFHP31]|nr:hypothetical protein PQX77_019240 [Marasmius sp. AFHP31]
MGLIWIKKPILWNSSRKASYNFSTMTPEQAKMVVAKWTFWYESDWDYGHPTVIFFCVAVACAMLLNLGFWLRKRSSSQSSSTAVAKPSSVIDRITAAIRYTIARQYRFRVFHWYSPPLSAIIAVSGMFIFIFALMLGPRPYYWPNMAMGHSPPIATRSGWLSIAIMPFMIAFATKVNFITMLTGTSHEKLQVFHRWSALLMYITSLVHTFPFIEQALRLNEMDVQWKTNWYWTGVAALVPQTYLVFLSWGFFRNKYYETFKKLHLAAAAVFMAFLFIHCSFRLSSWDFFAATAAIYFIPWFFRFFRTFYNGLGLPASVEVLPDGRSLRLVIETPSRVKWSPGQHAFIRFLGSGIHAFSSHPFTVSSLTSDGHMEFVFNIHRGVTSKLAKMAEGKASINIRVMVDGPYGGVPSLESYDHVYLLAGGTGVTLTLPLLADLVKGDKNKSIEFVVAVKKRGGCLSTLFEVLREH